MVWMVIYLTLASGQVTEATRAAVSADACLPLMEQTKGASVFVSCLPSETGETPELGTARQP